MLIVDDEALIRRGLARVLAEHEVTTCENGAQAVDLFERDIAFDAVLCDLHMPGTDGLAVYAAARRRAPGLERRFLFLTGGGFEISVAQFLEREQAKVIQKPASPDEIRLAIQDVLTTGSRAG